MPKAHLVTPSKTCRRARRQQLVSALCLCLAANAAQAGVPSAGMAALGRLLHGESSSAKASRPKQKPSVVVDQAVTEKNSDASAGSRQTRAQQQASAFANRWADALFARDVAPLLSVVSPQYRIDDLPNDKKPLDYLRQAIEQLPAPSELRITGVSLDATRGVTVVKLTLTQAAGLQREKVVHLDGEGRLVWSDLFKLRQETRH